MSDKGTPSPPIPSSRVITRVFAYVATTLALCMFFTYSCNLMNEANDVAFFTGTSLTIAGALLAALFVRHVIKHVLGLINRG